MSNLTGKSDLLDFINCLSKIKNNLLGDFEVFKQKTNGIIYYFDNDKNKKEIKLTNLLEFVPYLSRIICLAAVDPHGYYIEVSNESYIDTLEKRGLDVAIYREAVTKLYTKIYTNYILYNINERRVSEKIDTSKLIKLDSDNKLEDIDISYRLGDYAYVLNNYVDNFHELTYNTDKPIWQNPKYYKNNYIIFSQSDVEAFLKEEFTNNKITINYVKLADDFSYPSFSF